MVVIKKKNTMQVKNQYDERGQRQGRWESYPTGKYIRHFVANEYFGFSSSYNRTGEYKNEYYAR